MSRTGYLISSDPENLDYFTGVISTLELSLTIELRPHPRRGTSEKTPTHIILGKSPDGRTVEIGAAWLRDVKWGSHAGKKFLSLSIDQPSFSKPLNLAAYPPEVGDEWDVVFRRRTGNAA